MKEAAFQRDVEELCRWRGLLYYHVARSDLGRTQSGFPDLVIVGNRTIFAELKTETGKQSKAQKRWEHALRISGQTCYLWRPADMGQINQILAGLAAGV